MRRFVVLAALALASTAARAQAPTAPFAAAGTVRWQDVDLRVEFHAAGDLAALTVRLPDKRVVPLRVMTGVDDAIAVLADERMAFAWPALLAWAGPDLTTLRDRAVTRATLADETGFAAAPVKSEGEEFSGSYETLTLLQHASALWSAGRRDEALALLRKRAGALATDSRPRDDGFAKVVVGDRLASFLFDSGDEAGALATLETLRGDARVKPKYRLNADVNYALVSARSGQYQAALTTITAALAQFRAFAPDEASDDVKVPDSEANFAAIKACALDGLGQHERARALMNGISIEGEVRSATSSIGKARLTGFLCLRDAEGLARELARQLDEAEPAADVFRVIQPGDEPRPADAAVLAAALREPVLAAAMRGKARLLPPVFGAAVRGWSPTLDGGAGAR